MISEIRNPYLRRALLVWTVLAIVVCMGPVHLIFAVLEWVDREFEVDLVSTWRGLKPKGKE